jgi:histidyl-tRNA synthetase
MKLQKIRGVADLYDKEIDLFNYIIGIAQKLAKLHCFQEISTPIMENSEVFHRTLGETSDIVNKETYSFLDRDKTHITLRPEFTAAIVRAVISNGMLQSIPLRLFSYGPLFRHERPQKCRLRQFHQINYEYIGSNNLNVDVELIMLANDILKELEINNNVKLVVNTLGDDECRNKYKTALIEYLLKYKDELSEISQQRLEKNPLRILDTKNNKEQEILNDAPILYNFIDKDSKIRFEAILSRLKDFDINFEHSNKLVRGIDYYSDFVFEFVTCDLGSQGTILAGGRYNTLISQMGGNLTPAAGFAGGIERMLELLQIKQKSIEKEAQIYLIPIGESAENHGIKIAQEFRRAQINTLIDYGIPLKKKMQKANKLGVKYSVLFGDEELNDNAYILKNMLTGDEKKLKIEELINFLKEIT